MDACFIANQHLHAEFKSRGAELVRFRTISGVDFLWDGEGSNWNRRAPHLFPIVGQLKNDVFHHKGRDYHMDRHGFARDLDWDLVRVSREFCTFRLRDDEATRAQFPFAFDLRVTYRVVDLTLEVHYDLFNPGPDPLPASLGAHPAFRWPLAKDGSRSTHRIEFPQTEPGLVHRLVGGLLDPNPRPTPVQDRTLMLHDDLFSADALIFTSLQSHSLRYLAPSSLGLEIHWKGFRQLGLWSKPGAGFLCIEPWRGTASPLGWDGEFPEKPGLDILAPGTHRTYLWSAKVV